MSAGKENFSFTKVKMSTETLSKSGITFVEKNNEIAEKRN